MNVTLLTWYLSHQLGHIWAVQGHEATQGGRRQAPVLGWETVSPRTSLNE